MLKAVDLSAADRAEAVTNSLLQSGFAVLVNHPLDPDQLLTLYRKWDEFFVSGEAAAYEADVNSQTGYFSPHHAETAKGGEAQDLKEYFHFTDGGTLPDPVAEVTKDFHQKMFELGQQVLNWVQENTSTALWQSLDQPLHTYLSSPHSMLRILRYPPLTGNEPPGAIRAGAHEDINFITLLPTASQSGLEIKPKGQDWQPVDAPAGAIIVNIGDMLQELTRGKLPSTTHRVVNPTGRAAQSARLTAPLFCHPIGTLRLSERHTADSYLRERLGQINPQELRPTI